MSAPDPATLRATLQALAERLLGTAQLTAPQVAEAAGVSLEAGKQLWQALGFAPVADDEPIFTSADVAMLRAARQMVEQGVTAPGVRLQMARVIGQSLARVATAEVEASAETLREPQFTLGLVEQLEAFLTYAWRRHLVAAAARQAAAAETATGGAMAVGFADLAGFTALSRQLEPRELASLVDRFEALAYDHIPPHGGRVVKMIGDEVMFSADDVAAGAAIALTLARAQVDELPPLRVGLAAGPVLAWEGDLFGPTVNLASRLVGLARPNTALVSEGVAQHLEGHPVFTVRRLPPVNLKGLGRERVYALRAQSDSSAP